MGKKKSNELSTDVMNLAPNHRRFVTLYLSGQYTLIKIGELMDVHPNTVGKWMKRVDVKEYLATMQNEQQALVHNQLMAMTTKATNKLSDLIDSNIDGVALQAVKDVLDRGGHKAKQEIKKEVTITSFEQQMSDVMKETMMDVVDAEYTEV